MGSHQSRDAIKRIRGKKIGHKIMKGQGIEGAHVSWPTPSNERPHDSLHSYIHPKNINFDATKKDVISAQHTAQRHT